MSVMDYWKGALFGFLFGTIGLFLLALLALIHPFFEIITYPFFLPGRLIAPDNASTLIVTLLYLGTGVFYALLGMLVQWLVKKARQ